MKTYKKLCTKFYDLDKPKAPGDAVSFLLEHLNSTKKPVLEPMSGSGRFLIHLLQCGINIEGIEPSPNMLKACRKHCTKLNINPVIYEGFLDSVMLPKTYACIFILAGSFGLIADSNLAVKSLNNIYNHLNKHGKFIVEIETPIEKICDNQEWYIRSVNCTDGSQIVCRTKDNYNSLKKINRVSCEYQLIQDGKKTEEEHEDLFIRYYELQEFYNLLSYIGFTDISCVRPYGHTIANETDETAVFICRKS